MIDLVEYIKEFIQADNFSLLPLVFEKLSDDTVAKRRYQQGQYG